jgi:MFS family permease
MISALFPDKMRSLMVGLWTAALPLGSAIGIMVGGYIAARYGWRQAFGIVALPGFLVALLFFLVRDYQTVDLETRRGPGSPEQGKRKTAEIARQFLRTPSLLLNYAAFAGCMFLSASYLSWLPTYFHRVENLPVEQAAFKGSLVMLLAIAGFPLGGFLADRWRQKRMNARLLFPALSSLFTGGIFFGAFYFLQGSSQYALILLGGLAASTFSPAAIAVTQDVVHPGLRATSYSFCVIAQNLLGSSLGPLFVGAVSDRYGIQYALTLVPLFSILAAILFFAGSFFYETDLAKVEKIPLRAES